MRKFSIAMVILFIALNSYSQTKEPIKVTDMLKIKSINGINLSKDGNRAVFTVTAIEPDGDSKWEYKYVIAKTINNKRKFFTACMES